MSHIDSDRPSTLLDEFQSKYGYDKYRQTSDSHKVMSYVRISRYEDGDWIAKWHLGGIAENPLECLTGAFQFATDAIIDGRSDSQVPYLDALVLMSHGEGRFSFVHPDTGENCSYEDLPEESRKLVDATATNDLHLRARVGETMPSRVINIITPSGLAADVSTWYEGEVFVERHEQWTEDGEGTVPEGNGAVDQALMGSFTFAHLIRETIGRGADISVGELIETATLLSKTEAGANALAYLLRIVATGVESGLLEGLAD